jgi:ribosomal protein S18 acetylase RimI-like enzyme
MEDGPVSDDAVGWCSASQLTGAEFATVAAWIYSMDPNYYDLFSDDKLALRNRIQQLCLEQGSEFFPLRVIRKHNRIAGFVDFFPGGDVFARRIHVLKALLALCPNQGLIKKRLQEFGAARGAVAPDSLYLSKMYVAPEWRGTGIARVLLEDFISSADALGKEMTLHVEHTNAKAIALYERWGFFELPAGASGNYRFMRRPSKKEGNDAVS